jgi:hypothetical protein
VLEYSSGSLDVSVAGDDLTVSSSPAGTFVTAVIKKTKIVPGAVTSFCLVVPGVVIGGANSVAVHTVGMLAVHRGASLIGPGQLETYTSMDLKGTAASIVMPD